MSNFTLANTREKKVKAYYEGCYISTSGAQQAIRWQFPPDPNANTNAAPGER